MMRSAAPTQRLLLFDIDGTLIHKGGMGSAAMRRAFHQRHGIEEALQRIRLDGRTDWSICREIFQNHSLPWSDSAWNDIIEAYVACLEVEAKERPCGQLCPGIVPLLEHVAANPDFVVGLLTGNVRRGAEIKLRTFGIWHHFRLGAYGCDRERREELVEVAAVRAAEEAGLRFAPRQIVIIGDTPADIAAAQHGGCVSLAVATGRYSTRELLDHGAEVALEDLSDLQEVLRAMQWPNGRAPLRMGLDLQASAT
jgi:phosphoglycolate phosphatase